MDTTPDAVPGEHQHEDDFGSSAVEETSIDDALPGAASINNPVLGTAIDDVALGAPIDDIALGLPFDRNSSGSSAADDVSCPPAAGTVDSTVHNQQSTQLRHHQITAGCVWDADDYSCSYDATIMSFLFMFRNSSSQWRTEWRQQAPGWNNTFGDAFESLLATVQSGQSSQDALSHKFDSLRETFRDELSRISPDCFPRHGRTCASVCRIFSHIFSSPFPSEHEPHLQQEIVCNWCDTSVIMRCSFALLGSNCLLGTYRHEGDIGPFLPLQTAVTRYVQRALHKPQRKRCPTCSTSGSLRVESLSMPGTTWLWIELCDPVSPITPSSRLVFSLQEKPQVFTLQAGIYLGGEHFTARLLDQSATWWKYDGMWGFGAPRVDHIEDEAELLENDDRRAAFLVYCRVNCSD